MIVTIGVSNHHVHLTKNDLETLFGKNYELQELKKINQPGQFSSTSTVTLKGPNGTIDNVRVLGPVRNYSQVEISKTDSYILGIDPPVRMSGDLKNSAPITIIGPNGNVDLNEGCIIAARHIHVKPKQLELYDLKNRQKVSVKIGGEKGGIINNVFLSVSENSYFELHIDNDDANAHLVNSGDIAYIIK